MKKRIEYLDILRVIACLSVLTTHSVMPNKEENGIWLGMISVLCSASSELFLTLSGAILLPVHVGFYDFYKRRFMKLIPPMFTWSLFGIMVNLCEGTVDGRGAISKLIHMPVTPVNGIFWFLYVMIGLYLFAPFISYWLRESSKRQVEFFLVIWGINMIAPWVNIVQPGFYNEEGSYYWPFSSFGGFLGYWILGYYLRRFNPSFRSFFGGMIVVLSILYPVALIMLKRNGYNAMDYNGNLQIGSACWVSFIFMFIKRITSLRMIKPCLPIFSTVSIYSFGIYLMHPYVVRSLVWRLFENNRIINHPIMETLLIVLMSASICLGIIYILSRNKYCAKFLFGLK